MATKYKLIGLLLLSWVLSSTAQTKSIDTAYQQSVDKWKSELVEGRKNNWLPLAGLFWLKPGENNFGTDSKNAVVFPKGPAKAGSFELNETDVTLKLSEGAQATVQGKPVSTTKLEPDTSKDRTVVEMGSLRFYAIVRGKRIGIRLKDLDSQAIRDYKGPVFFPLDPKFRITAKWVPSDGKKTVEVPNVLGDVEPVTSAGTAVFEINGKKFELTDLGGDPAQGL